MWISSYILAMVVSLIQYRLFPGEMETINEGLNDVIYSVPFWVSVIVVALLPAICEEAVHRGVIIHTMYRIRKEWLVVLIMGIYFGLFHANHSVSCLLRSWEQLCPILCWRQKIWYIPPHFI